MSTIFRHIRKYDGYVVTKNKFLKNGEYECQCMRMTVSLPIWILSYIKMIIAIGFILFLNFHFGYGWCGAVLSAD